MAEETLEQLEAGYRPWYEEAGKHNWEFSQMFGEEDSDSELSGSDSEDGTLDLSCSKTLKLLPMRAHLALPSHIGLRTADASSFCCVTIFGEFWKQFMWC
jgi:hypothetical protein